MYAIPTMYVNCQYKSRGVGKEIELRESDCGSLLLFWSQDAVLL